MNLKLLKAKEIILFIFDGSHGKLYPLLYTPINGIFKYLKILAEASSILLTAQSVQSFQLEGFHKILWRGKEILLSLPVACKSQIIYDS